MTYMAVRLITLVCVKPAEFSANSSQHTICSLNSKRPRLSVGLMSTARLPTCSHQPFGSSSGESSAFAARFLDYYVLCLLLPRGHGRSLFPKSRGIRRPALLDWASSRPHLTMTPLPLLFPSV